MYILQKQEIVQLFSLTTIPSLLWEWCSITCTIICLLGQSASFLIAGTLFSTLPKYVTLHKLDYFVVINSYHTMHIDCLRWLLILLLPLQVGVQTSQMEMLPSNAEMFSWETFNEDTSSLDDSLSFTTLGLMEQINVTRDTSDYLWYITRWDKHPDLMILAA